MATFSLGKRYTGAGSREEDDEADAREEADDRRLEGPGRASGVDVPALPSGRKMDSASNHFVSQLDMEVRGSRGTTYLCERTVLDESVEIDCDCWDGEPSETAIP